MSTKINETTAALDSGFLEEWSQRWLGVWNDHDVEGIVSMCTEDVSADDPALPETVHGHVGMRRFAVATFETFADVRIEELKPPHVSTSSAMASSPYRFLATMSGPWKPLNIAATGARVDFYGIDQWEFRGELLCHYATLYDSLDVARQIGMLPKLGGRADRVLSRLQHVQARVQRHANGAGVS